MLAGTRPKRAAKKPSAKRAQNSAIYYPKTLGIPPVVVEVVAVVEPGTASRGWCVSLENAADLGQLAKVDADDCTLVVGAPKWVRGGGGPARVLALCEE